MRDYAVDLPVALRADLLEQGWSGSSTPFPGQSPADYAMTSLWNSILKKFGDAIPETADQRALTLFKSVNESCKEFTWNPSLLTEIDAIAVGEARGFIHRFFFPDHVGGGFSSPTLSFGNISSGLGVGPGANIGALSNDFMSKIGTSILTASNQQVLDLFQAAVMSSPGWKDVESIRQAVRGSALVEGSRLSFVPKTREISRTICTEPIGNMFLQMGIGTAIRRRLRQVSNIDLSTQPDNNRSLARLGSKTGKFGTIDLSSASDSMSLGLVREFFPLSVVRWLELARTPVTVLPDGTKVELHMVSSMGNAFTFPLQTLFFLSLVYGVYKARGIPFLKPHARSLGNFAVFGDDIIVENTAYDHVVKLLNLCGFKVNVDKSFNDGLFRESCGEDYYFGRNVRGVYFKTLLTVNDRYSAINRLNVWSYRESVILPRTIAVLMRGTRMLPVPFHESDDAGIKVPLTMVKKIVRDRYTGAHVYRASVVSITSYSVADVEAQPPKIRGWFNNPPAVLMAALAGTLRDGRVIPRLSRKTYRLRLKKTPCWESFLGIRSELLAPVDDGWKAIIELNLGF